jgi:hypothetical protein
VANKNGPSIVLPKHGINFRAFRHVLQGFEIHQFYAAPAMRHPLLSRAPWGTLVFPVMSKTSPRARLANKRKLAIPRKIAILNP